MPYNTKWRWGNYFNIFVLEKDELKYALGYGALGLSGLAANLILKQYLGFEAVGIFGVALAIVVFSSQLGTLGVHLSLQQSIPAHKNILQLKSSITSALTIVALLSSIVCVLLFFVIPLIPFFSPILKSNQNLGLYLPAIFFFSLNKIILGALNVIGNSSQWLCAQLFRAFVLVSSLFCFLCI